jgi:cell wall-associated NlpC family hydrolase
MKSIYSILLYILTYNSISICSEQVQKAVINVPIADLIGQQIITMRPDQSPQTAYNSIALCGGKTNSTYSCPRLHQALYNDIIEIIKIVDDEAYIHIPQTYYLTPSSSTPQSNYWTLKTNITPLAELTQHNIPRNHMPEPINFNTKDHQELYLSHIITLTQPHYDPTLQMDFSVGTRFVCAPTVTKKKNTIEVFAINFKTHTEHRIKIPVHKCMIADDQKSTHERITDYVHLLKKWAHTKHGCIPYTWGGTSFAHATHGTFKEVMHTTHNGDYSAYEYDKDNSCPKSGFDCSGVIARATQICGIPYFCKNTTTIAQCLQPITKEQTVSPGDLILIKGHVMAVSDVHKNLLIEARSYAHGYGKLHEIPLNQMFEGIETYQDLTDAYFNKSVIKLKDKEGKVRGTFANLQLFSMASVMK